MAIWLVRHGETDLNAARVLQNPDTPLSARGIDQARRLGARLRSQADVRAELILSSDHERARMTAERIADATGIPIEVDALLQERSFGALRGRPYDDLDVDVFDPAYTPPDGESWRDFEQRVARAWAAVTRRSATLSSDLIVVSHGLVCRALAARHLQLPDGAQPAWHNSCLTRIDGGPPWVVDLLACTAHLEGPAIATAPA